MLSIEATAAAARPSCTAAAAAPAAAAAALIAALAVAAAAAAATLKPRFLASGVSEARCEPCVPTAGVVGVAPCAPLRDATAAAPESPPAGAERPAACVPRLASSGTAAEISASELRAISASRSCCSEGASSEPG